MSENEKLAFERSTNGVETTSAAPPQRADDAEVFHDVRAAAGSVAQGAEHVVDRVRDEGVRALARGKGFLDDQLGARARHAGEQLGHLASAVRGAGEQLGDTAVAPYVAKLGEGLERAAKLLREASVDEALHGAESYARAHPWMFLGGALAAGLAGGRVLRSAHSALERGIEDLEDAPRKKPRARSARA